MLSWLRRTLAMSLSQVSRGSPVSLVNGNRQRQGLEVTDIQQDPAVMSLLSDRWSATDESP